MIRYTIAYLARPLVSPACLIFGVISVFRWAGVSPWLMVCSVFATWCLVTGMYYWSRYTWGIGGGHCILHAVLFYPLATALNLVALGIAAVVLSVWFWLILACFLIVAVLILMLPMVSSLYDGLAFHQYLLNSRSSTASCPHCGCPIATGFFLHENMHHGNLVTCPSCLQDMRLHW